VGLLTRDVVLAVGDVFGGVLEYKDIFISLSPMPDLGEVRPHLLPTEKAFQALADPTRLRILALLRAMELSVGELAQVLGQSQPRVSRHVKILIDAGLPSGARKAAGCS
jgi:predicted transcriptional regulator